MWTAPSDGTIYLIVNDCFHPNNTGGFSGNFGLTTVVVDGNDSRGVAINVTAGTTYPYSFFGITYNGNGQNSGPDGIYSAITFADCGSSPSFPCPSARPNALVGLFYCAGSSGPPCTNFCALLGSSGTFVAPFNGSLAILVNDADYTNNTGSFTGTFDGAAATIVGNNSTGIIVAVEAGVSYDYSFAGTVNVGGGIPDSTPDGLPDIPDSEITGITCPTAPFCSLIGIFACAAEGSPGDIPCTDLSTTYHIEADLYDLICAVDGDPVGGTLNTHLSTTVTNLTGGCAWTINNSPGNPVYALTLGITSSGQTYFNPGSNFSAGTYTAQYLSGAMQVFAGRGWSVHTDGNASPEFFFSVSDSSSPADWPFSTEEINDLLVSTDQIGQSVVITSTSAGPISMNVHDVVDGDYTNLSAGPDVGPPVFLLTYGNQSATYPFQIQLIDAGSGSASGSGAGKYWGVRVPGGQVFSLKTTGADPTGSYSDLEFTCPITGATQRLRNITIS